MRTKDEHIRKTCTKRKKKIKKTENAYEPMSQNSHLGGASFMVDNETDRMFKWKKLMYTREKERRLMYTIKVSRTMKIMILRSVIGYQPQEDQIKCLYPSQYTITQAEY